MNNTTIDAYKGWSISVTANMSQWVETTGGVQWKELKR